MRPRSQTLPGMPAPRDRATLDRLIDQTMRVIGQTKPGRAATSAQKRAIIERVLAAWEKVPTMRLGQLLVNATWRGKLVLLEDGIVAASCEVLATRSKGAR